MKTLKLFDDVKEIGGGSFTGCSSLRNLVMFLKEDGISCIKDVVSETFHEMYVSIVFLNTDERAELIFPEYYEEAWKIPLPEFWKRIFMGVVINTASALRTRSRL